jgi:hypothetical protein
MLKPETKRQIPSKEAGRAASGRHYEADSTHAAQHTIGNQAVQRLLLQAQAGLGGDRHEQEADRVADQVMRTPESRQQDLHLSPVQQQGTAAAMPPSVHEVLSSPAQPLDLAMRAFFEPRFGRSFGQVHIHTDARAVDSARDLKARAYTVGRDIVFGAGEYRPGAAEGKRLLAHELAHVVQQTARAPVLQRTPSAAAEGAAQTGEANPRWTFQRTMVGRGFIMNPAFWQVTYYLRSGESTIPFTNRGARTALENVRQYLNRHPPQGGTAVVERIEVALRPDVTASAAARDLLAPASRRLYSFECFTAAALVQFVGVWRGLQQTSPATADATFNQRYADFRVTLTESGGPQLRMGGGDIQFNLAQLGDFTLRELLDDPSDRGLQRGDWVYLSNASFITRGAFQGENATYLGNKRFYGHGIGVFSIDQYVDRLRRRHHVTLSRDQILDQVRVRPRYRAPETVGATGAAPAP